MADEAEIIQHVVAMATATGDDALTRDISNEVPEELIRHVMVTACVLFSVAVEVLVDLGVVESKDAYFQQMSLSALETFGGD